MFTLIRFIIFGAKFNHGKKNPFLHKYIAFSLYLIKKTVSMQVIWSAFSIHFLVIFLNFTIWWRKPTLTYEIILVCFFSKMDVKEVIQKEMKNVLTAFEEQTIRSLGIIKMALHRCRLSIPPDFKQYFIQSSNDR